jgi:hypothetical protein
MLVTVAMPRLRFSLLLHFLDTLGKPAPANHPARAALSTFAARHGGEFRKDVKLNVIHIPDVKSNANTRKTVHTAEVPSSKPEGTLNGVESNVVDTIVWMAKGLTPKAKSVLQTRLVDVF